MKTEMDKEILKTMKALKTEVEILNNTLPNLDTDRIRYTMKKLYTDAQQTREELDSVSLRSQEIERNIKQSGNYIEEIEKKSDKIMSDNKNIYESNDIMYTRYSEKIELKNIIIICLVCVLLGFSLGSWVRIERTKSVVVEWWRN